MIDFSELLNWREYSRLLIALLAITNPVSTVPVFLGLIGDRPPADMRRTALFASIAVAVTLLIFVFLGDAILDLFGITIHAFRIAGGILLLLVALEMMRLKASVGPFELERTSLASVAVVPIAIPLLAGPGAITTVIVFSSLHDSAAHDILVSTVVLSVACITYVVLRFAPMVSSFVGPTGITVLERVAGLIIAAIAIEFVLDGISGHFPDITTIHD